jgi:N-acetylglutamate synthase-like GNAT family acetyltransferase
VHPEHGRRGIGAALVGRACEWAREQALACVTLTTFRDIPWNAPFYRQLGFEELPSDRWDDELRERVAEEAESGLDPDARLVMRLRLDPT